MAQRRREQGMLRRTHTWLLRVTALGTVVVALGPAMGCAAEAARECQTGADCHSGACSGDGLCVDGSPGGGRASLLLAGRPGRPVAIDRMTLEWDPPPRGDGGGS